MRHICTIIVIAATWMAISAATAAAQAWPGHHRYYGYYGGYGYNSAVVIYDLGSAGNARRYAAQSERLLGQQIAAQQMAATQSGIRNAMEADAQRRVQNAFLQQQADRDWWFQTQQQQVAQRQALAAQLALIKAAEGFDSATPAALDLIKWPSVLRDPQFAERRARIENPYRRGSKVPSTPTAKDCQEMIETAGQMKMILKGMAANISARDYLDAEAFLDQLAAEARGKLGKAVSGK